MSEVSRHSAIPTTELLPVHDFVDAEQQVVGRCKVRVDSVDRGGQALRVPQTVERSNCGGLMSWLWSLTSDTIWDPPVPDDSTSAGEFNG
jgi:hypothetical protein